MFLLIISLLCLSINAQNYTSNNEINTHSQPSINIAVAEHEPSNTIANVSDDLSWQTTTERTLIRVTRLNDRIVPSKVEKRSRRQIIEAIQTAGVVIHVAKAIQNTESGEQILGMAKKVAITVIVISSLCAVCCLITTVVVCVKCCCGGRDRKRNKGPMTVQVPQPIYVHTGVAGGYQPQYYQQQAAGPQGWSSMPMQSPESRPMLPQPSAPPRPNDSYHMEHPPPPYEKLYTGK